MDRHWRELTARSALSGFEPFDVQCPFGEPPMESRKARRHVRIWNKYFWFPWRIRLQRGFAAAHVLDHSCAHFLRHVPASVVKVVTVHDLAPLAEPGSLTEAQLRRFRRCVEWLNRADILLPVSRYTADALRAFLTSSPQIEVLPMGVNVGHFSNPKPGREGRQLPTCPKILSVGSCVKRKNLDLLPALLRRVTDALGPVALVRVGESLPTDLRGRLCAFLAPENLIELGYLADEGLVSVYQSADVLLFPSRLEGFGLPVAEAMAAGCPVVCSRASSLPEVGGDAALYFDPSDDAEAAAAVIKVLQNGELRGRMVECGRHRAAELSWENHASRLAEIYRRALARDGG